MTDLADDPLDQVRQVFGALNDAERLRALPFTAQIVAAAGDDISSPRICAIVRDQIDAAVESLDARARTIVVRCDIAGETHRTVAADLGIGERYFYRERRRALADLAPRLVRHYAPAATVDVAPSGLALSAATALRNAGRYRDAVAVLRAAFAGESTPSGRITMAVRLAELAADLGNTADTAMWIARGRTDLAALGDAPAVAALAACELDLAEIRSEILCDAFESAERRARRVARRLATLASAGQRDRIAVALCTAAVYVSETQIIRGRFSDALAWALDGQAALQAPSSRNAGVEIAVLGAVAHARFFASGSIARAEADFRTAYARAVESGLPGEAAKIAASFALALSAAKDHERARTFLDTAHTLGRRFLTAGERVALSIELAGAALAKRDLAAANTLVRAALPRARGLDAVVLTMIDAEIHCASGFPEAALTFARQAVREFAAMGNNRLLGSAYRIEAECLAAIGERSFAANSISTALTILNEAGNIVSLSRAFAVSASVTGNRRHRVSARELNHAFVAQ